MRTPAFLTVWAYTRTPRYALNNRLAGDWGFRLMNRYVQYRNGATCWVRWRAIPDRPYTAIPFGSPDLLR